MLDPHQLFYSVLAMNALVASLAWCLAKPNWASIVSVVVSAAVWPLANKSFEGRTIVLLSPTHGITTHDLLSVVAVGVAGVGVIRWIWAQKS